MVIDMKDYTKFCTWAVAHKIAKETQDDGKTKIRVVAFFRSPANAEDFINNCLPVETKDDFFIIDVDKLNSCKDADKVQKITEIKSLYARVID